MYSDLAANTLTLARIRAKVLIADDCRIQGKLLQQILQGAGYKTIVACDGMEAVESFRQEQPDLVLLRAQYGRHRNRLEHTKSGRISLHSGYLPL